MPLDRKYVAGAIAAFIAWALLTDALPSLRWIPHAFLLGVAVTVAGLLYLILTTSNGPYNADRDSVALAAARLPRPAFARYSKERWEEEKVTLRAKEEYRRPTIFPGALTFSKSIDGLLNLILRDYVTSWYGAISSRPLFQNEIDRCIRSVLLTFAARIMELDVVQIGVNQLLPAVTVHLKDFYDAERAVRGKDLGLTITESDGLDDTVASKYRNGTLHSVAALSHPDLGSQMEAYLRDLVQRIMPVVLPENMKTSPAVLSLIRELVTCAVLSPVLNLLCDPDFSNQMIVNLGGPMLQDRKTVRKVRAALDQHTSNTLPRGSRGAQLPRLRPYDSERQFERFIRAIRRVSTLSEARRFRSEVSSQLRKVAAVEGQDAAFVRRLETGRKLLDQKIVSLSAEGVAGIRPTLTVEPPESRSGDSETRKRNATLRDVIYDATGLSYFMEYMDRLNLMRLVQFYLVVDGFRGPLEGDNDEPAPAAISDGDRLDVAQMYDNYLSKPEIQAPDAALFLVRHYMKTQPGGNLREYIAARRAVLQSQTKVYNMMKETHLVNFKRSDLYYKWLAVDDAHLKSRMPSTGRSHSLLSPDGLSSSDESPVTTKRPHVPSHPSSKREPELRRAVLSTTDLKSSSKSTASIIADGRRSLDDSSRPALFDDSVEDDHMSHSLTSLNEDSDSESVQLETQREQARAVRDMQLALDNIVSHELDDSTLSHVENRDGQPPVDTHGHPHALLDASHLRPQLFSRSSSTASKPSIASLGLIGGPSSRGVFVDDLFAEEAAKFTEDEREDSEARSGTDDDNVQEAAPGDLGLTEAIDTLNADIERLIAQRGVLDSLTAKAELTNNTAELRILRKSEQSLTREVKRKEMQKRQYVVQESDNSLYGRAAVTIKSVMVGREESTGHEYALYVIEVRRQAGDSIPAATWAITRRYSQFHELHKRLRARFPSVRDLDFPRRQTLFSLQKDFIQRRRAVLERYLRSLLLVPAICRSREFRAFLSQSAIASNGGDHQGDANKDFVTRIYDSVSDGMEEFLGNIPVLDQLSAAGQNLISAASAQLNASGSTAMDALDPATQDPKTAAEAEAELNAYDSGASVVKENAQAAQEPFVKPICDLFLETFELTKGNSWLRGRTVVVVLHQLLGGTIERKVRDSARTAFQDEGMAKYVDLLSETMWPGGKQRPPSEPRTVAQKARTRKEAGLILGALIPDLAGSIVGKGNSVAAARKLAAVVNNQRLKYVFPLYLHRRS